MLTLFNAYIKYYYIFLNYRVNTFLLDEYAMSFVLCIIYMLCYLFVLPIYIYVISYFQTFFKCVSIFDTLRLLILLVIITQCIHCE